MHVFVTGATGWVGSQVAADLLAHGRRAYAARLAQAGAHLRRRLRSSL